MTLFNCGPPVSIASIRARYFSTNDRAVNLPDSIPRCRSSIDSSLNSNDGSLNTDGGEPFAEPFCASVRYPAANALPATPAARNDRRLGRFGFGENRISRGTLLLRMLEHGDEKRLAVAPASPVIHRRRHDEPAMVCVGRVNRQRVSADAEYHRR